MCWSLFGQTKIQEQIQEESTTKPAIQPNVFCSSLEYMRVFYHDAIPTPLKQLVTYMEYLDRLKTPYIFKIDIKNDNIRRMIDQGNRGIELKPQSEHEACTLIKQFFKALPHPVIPSSLILKFQWLNSQQQAAEMREIMSEKIPHYNSRILIYILRFFDRVIKHKDENKMGAFELATEFNNLLCWPDRGRITNESMYNTFFFTEYVFAHRKLIIDTAE